MLDNAEIETMRELKKSAPHTWMCCSTTYSIYYKYHKTWPITDCDMINFFERELGNVKLYSSITFSIRAETDTTVTLTFPKPILQEQLPAISFNTHDVKFLEVKNDQL